jgi:hypothetical protein
MLLLLNATLLLQMRSPLKFLVTLQRGSFRVPASMTMSLKNKHRHSNFDQAAPVVKPTSP